MRDAVIRTTDLCREFPVDTGRRTLFRVLQGFVRGVHLEKAQRKALHHVTLSVAQGEKIAIVGNNGAGKTTLLKVIAGLLRPTSGSVLVHGEMALLTALGAGMIDDLSVYDNTMLYGALYGVNLSRMRAAIPDILEWAEISGYEYAKLKTLSSGMRARLAFSVVRYIHADILLIDEALSAGDVTFRAKCRAFFDEPRNREGTFLMATHDLDFAKSFCTRALWLHQGEVMAFGDTEEVIASYLAGSRIRLAQAAAAG